MTIILIGILTISAGALFLNPSALNALAVRDQLLAAVQQAQLTALSNGLPVRLTLSQTATDGQLVTVLAPGTAQAQEVQRQQYDRDQASLSVNGANLGNGASWIQTFSSQGDVPSRQQLLFNSGSSYALCLASSGYAYSGNCQP